MNIWGSCEITKLPHALWRRFQIWRANRMYAAIPLLKIEADRLMRENAQPPMPLFDGLDK